MRGIYHVTFVLFCFSVLLVLDKVIRPKIANFAAGIAVRKLGTATVSNEELKEVLGEYYVD